MMPLHLLRKANMRKLWLSLLILVLIIGAGIGAPLLMQPHNARFSLLEKEGTTIATLYAEHIDDGTPITITIIDSTGQYYILPAIKITETTWQAAFPLTSIARAIAEQEGKTLATTDLVSKEETILETVPETLPEEKSVPVETRPEQVIIQTTAVQEAAEIGKPVQWTLRVSKEQKQNISISLPEQASIIEIRNEDKQRTLGKTARDTIKEQRTISEEGEQFTIIYETAAPQIKEEHISSTRKRVTISAKEHYTNVKSYTSIPKAPREHITLYWIQNTTKIPLIITNYIDEDHDGLVERIEWNTPHLSNQTFEIDISLINVQSYPTVGGTWEVRFTTIGTADLTISASNGTTWSTSYATNKDLQFLSLRCGENSITPTWQGDTLIAKDYTCDTTAYETSLVITPGVHTIQFTYGNETVYAKNLASYSNAASVQRYTTTTGRLISNTSYTNMNFTLSTLKDSLYYTTTNTTRIYVNKTGNYVISYGCAAQEDTMNGRITVGTWVAVNNTEIKPSRTFCHARSNAADAENCSTQAVFTASLTKGQYLNLRSAILKASAVGTVRTASDCWLMIQEETKPAHQTLHTSTTQTFSNTAEPAVTFQTNTITDGVYYTQGSNYTTIKQAGSYRISYQICADDGPQGTVNTPRAMLRRNSVSLPASTTYMYLSDNTQGDTNCLGATTFAELFANDNISVTITKVLTATAGGTSTLLANSTWLLIERLQNDDYVHVSKTFNGANVANGASAAASFDTNNHISSTFSHAINASTIRINKTGSYEISYTLGWNDNANTQNHIVCAWIRRNAATTIEPSKQCDYSRGLATSNVYGSVSATLIYNFTAGDNVSLMTRSTGGTMYTMQESVWLAIVPLKQSNVGGPTITNATVNETIIKAGQQARFSVTITETDYAVLDANATIDGMSVNLTKGSGNTWYYDYTCQAPSRTVNLTIVWATDSAIPSAITTQSITGVGVDCDAGAPNITFVRINDSSPAVIYSYVKVNASVVDNEGNLENVTLQIMPPAETPYNVSVLVSGNEYYVNNIYLDKGGKWYFTFYANDSAGNVISSQAQDILDNYYIEVDSFGETDKPWFANPAVNETLIGQGSTARFTIDIYDTTSGISTANVTIEGTVYDMTLLSGNRWYYDWLCSSSDATVSMTAASANDTVGNVNSTTVTGVSSACDVGAPLITQARVNASSEVPYDTVVRVNTSVVDTEGHLANVTLEIIPPTSAAYNVTPAQAGSQYYISGLLLNASGTWYFKFYAKDSVGQQATQYAQDGLANTYLTVNDPFAPLVSTPSILQGGLRPSYTNITISTIVTDNLLVDTVRAQITLPNGTITTIQLTPLGNDYTSNYLLPLPGTYTITILANDTSNNINNTQTTTVTAYDTAEDISITPLNVTTYAVAVADLNRIILQIRQATGGEVRRTLVDSTASDYSRVSIASINSTHFLVGWIDGVSETVMLALYDKNLNLIRGPTIIEAQVGAVAADDRVDISITVMNSTHATIGFVDDVEDDYDIIRWKYSTWAASGAEFGVDTTVGEDAVRQDYISNVAISANRIAHVYFDDGTNGPNIDVQLTTGLANIIAATDIFVVDGALSKVANAALRSLRAGYVFFDDLGNDVYVGIDDYTGDLRTVVLAPTMIAANVGTSGGVYATEIDYYGTSMFLASWHLSTNNNIQAQAYYPNGTLSGSIMTLATDVSTTYMLHALASSQSLRTVSLCNETFVFAYVNTTGALTIKQYYMNGSIWNGECGDTELPEVDQISPLNNYLNTTTKSVLFNFTCNASDNKMLKNISLYLTNASNASFSRNATTNITGLLARASWIINLSEGIYSWNCKVSDVFGNTAWADNYSINITDLRDLENPALNTVLPVVGTPYNVTQTIIIQVNATDNIALAEIYANITLPNSTIRYLELTRYGITSIYNATYYIPVLIGTYNVTYYVRDTSNNTNTTASNFTVSYGGLMNIGETYDPTENDYPFFYFANYTYADGTPITGASCSMYLLNHTKLGYYFEPEDALTNFNSTTRYGAVVFQYVENNTHHTDYDVEFHLAYTETGNRNWKVWVTNDTAMWSSTQTPQAIINKTTHPTLNETIQELEITLADNNFNTSGNYTIIFGCADCTATEYFSLGIDVDNFGHSYKATTTPATWNNMSGFNYEYMVELSPGNKLRTMTYNATATWYETLERLYLTKNTTYVYTWEANCSKAGHTAYSEQTTITIAINYAPIPNITSITENPAELGDNVIIIWDNDYTEQAFGFYDSYVNLSYANGTFIKQYEGSPFTIPASDLPYVGTYNLTAYSRNSKGSDTANSSFTVQDTTGPTVRNITPITGTAYYPSTIIIRANVTDLQAVDRVYANITWQGGASIIRLWDNNSDDVYEHNFTATILANYTVSILANDTENNRNDTQTTWFMIVDNIIGDESNIISNLAHVTIYLNGTRVNTSQYYDDIYNVTVYVNGTRIASFMYDFTLALNLTTMQAYHYADAGIAFSMPGQENISLYVPLQGVTCVITICEGVNNETACTVGNRRYETVEPRSNYCLVLVNGTYAKDAVDKTDFNVEVSDIVTLPVAPTEGVNMTLNVTVRNLGETWADNVTVLITDLSTGTLMLNYTIANFTDSENETISTWMIMTIGPHHFQVVIDPNNDYLELNETNNNASTWVNVSAWQTMYGSVNQTIMLAGVSSLFHTWTVASPEGFIYATDADASINWNNLTALGRNTYGFEATADFEETDIKLNMTGYADSITNLFTIEGITPHTLINKTLQGRLISYIPVTNSTNSSSFKTGIVWDASLDTDGEFDTTDNENLIFFTEINQDTLGTYGTYDYEIIIPSPLQRTTGADDMTYLYIEIT